MKTFLRVFLTLALTLPALVAQAQPFNNLHNFILVPSIDLQGTNFDGTQPNPGLVLSGRTVYGTADTGGPKGVGTVFSVDINGGNFKVLHGFEAQKDGTQPLAGLTLSGSTLYGTTFFRDQFDTGTIFSIGTDGAGFKTIYNFPGTDAGGYNPQTPVIVSGDTIYGDCPGGSNGIGMIFSLSTKGSGFKMLHSFTGGYDGDMPGTLVLSGTNLYGVSLQGGSNEVGVVFALSTNGEVFKVLHEFSGTPDGAYPSGGLVIAGDTLYGTTQGGGSSGAGTVYAVNTDGTGYTIVHSFTGQDATAYNAVGNLAISGNMVYGAAAGGTSGNGVIYAVNTDTGEYTNLYSFSAAGALQGIISNINTNSDGISPGGDLVFSDNVLYGTATYGGFFGSGTVFAFAVGPITLLTVTTISLSGGTNGFEYADQQLTAQGGQTPYTWKVSSGTLPTGLVLSNEGLLSGKPTKSDTFTFTVQVTDADSNTSTQSLTVTIITPDTTPPTLTITTPKKGATTTNIVYDITGTAKDNVAVGNVLVSVNGGAWAGSLFDDGSDEWLNEVVLDPGTNTILAYAEDTSGNDSKTNLAEVVYEVPAPIIVGLTGQGTITKDYNGQKLFLNETYSMTAKAAHGFVFTNWTDANDDAVLTTNATLKFLMETNLDFNANFVQ